MIDTTKITNGMQVYGSDRQELGRVEAVEDDFLRVSGQRVSIDDVERVDQRGVYLKGSGSRYFANLGTTGTQGAEIREAEGEIRVPVAEERLEVEKRAGEIGEVRVHKTVEEERQTVPVDLTREEVHVDRREVEARPLGPGETAGVFEEKTIRVPIRGEEAIAHKEAVVTGEVVINKERTTEHQEVGDTVRRQRVEIDDRYAKDRSFFQKDFATQSKSRKGGTTWQRFEEAEPYYRYGYDAAYDERYRGRKFEDVEADLRRDYERQYGTTGDPWERLRREVREGFNRLRDDR